VFQPLRQAIDLREKHVNKPALIGGIAAAALVAVPAQAHHKSTHPAKPAKPAKCDPHAVGYNARGTLVSSSLTQSAGQATAKKGDDRYDGTVTVDVTKANHKAPTGVQTFTLTGARVRFGDADHNHVADVPAAGDRVKLHGKITRLRKGCDATGFTPTITVRSVRFRAPKAPKP
jgi:hypothetical protein